MTNQSIYRKLLGISFMILLSLILVLNVSAKPEAYKIGIMAPMTGPNTDHGMAHITSAQLAVEDLNRRGGVDGVKVELIAEDNMADPKQGIAAFNKLTRVDKVPVVLAAWSTVVRAAAPLAESNGILLINYAANSPDLRGASKFLINTFPLADLDIMILAKYLYTEMGFRKAAVININNDTGNANARVFKETFTKSGGKIVGHETHEQDAIDFGPQLLKIKVSQPEVIHVASLLSEIPRIVKQAREMGMTSQFTSYSAAESKEMFTLAGQASDGLIFTSLAPPSAWPEPSKFLEKYRGKYQKDPSGSAYCMYIYDLVYTIIPEAIRYSEKMGWGFTGKGLRDAMLGRDYDTKTVGRTFIKMDGTIEKPVQLKKINFSNKSFDFIKMVELK